MVQQKCYSWFHPTWHHRTRMNRGLWGIDLQSLQWHALFKGPRLQVIFTIHNFQNCFMEFLSFESLLERWTNQYSMLLNSRLHWTHCTSIPYSLIFIPVKKYFLRSSTTPRSTGSINVVCLFIQCKIVPVEQKLPLRMNRYMKCLKHYVAAVLH